MLKKLFKLLFGTKGQRDLKLFYPIVVKVNSFEPEMQKDFSIAGIKTFLYDRPLNPGETQKVTFYLRAKEIGDFGGSIGVFVGDNAVRGDASISILP